MALKRDLYRGDDKVWRFELLVHSDLEESLIPYEIPVGAYFILTAKRDPLDPTDTTAIFQKRTNAVGQGAIISVPNGIIEFNIDRSDTLNLEPGLYVYDIQMVLAGAVKTMLHGQLALLSDVTRSAI